MAASQNTLAVLIGGTLSTSIKSTNVSKMTEVSQVADLPLSGILNGLSKIGSMTRLRFTWSVQTGKPSAGQDRCSRATPEWGRPFPLTQFHMEERAWRIESASGE